MNHQQDVRWIGFFAASLLAHVAVLGWMEWSSGGPSWRSSPIQVMLASARPDPGRDHNPATMWRPASAGRNRDLFAPPAATSPKRPRAGAVRAAPKEPGSVLVSNASSLEKSAPEAPPAEKPEAAAGSVPTRAPVRAIPGAAPASATKEAADPTAVAAAAINGDAFASPAVRRESAVTRSAAPSASVVTPSRSADTAAEDNAALLVLLHRAIDRGKRYPSLARRQRREGTATVRFRLSPNGEMDGIDIDRSSGFRALDSAAISAVSSVAPFAPARTLLSEATGFKVDVTFRLN